MIIKKFYICILCKITIPLLSSYTIPSLKAYLLPIGFTLRNPFLQITIPYFSISMIRGVMLVCFYGVYIA